MLGKVGISWNAACIETTLQVARSRRGARVILRIGKSQVPNKHKEHCSAEKRNASEFHHGNTLFRMNDAALAIAV